MKIQWKKLPSVTRTGKWFYRATIRGTTYTVLQSWLSGKWYYQDGCGNEAGQYDTAQAAMKWLAS
jgi:hypothetical protein